MKVQVLGSGCPTCKKLYELTKEVVNSLEANIELEYLTGVEGTQKIIEMGGMSSPVIAVDGKIALCGFTTDKKTIIQALYKEAKLK